MVAATLFERVAAIVTKHPTDTTFFTKR